MDSVARDLALSLGPQTAEGRTALVASMLLRQIAKPANVTAIDGFSKEPDISAEEFEAVRERVRDVISRIVAPNEDAAPE